jgi:transcriptional regulator with XRE-family HTH domain
MQLVMGQNTMATPKRVRVKRVTPFTEWFRDQLAEARLSQSEFARRAGLGGPAVVSRWLSGESKPSIEMARRIAEALRVDIDYVLEKAGYRPAALAGETSERGGILASMVKRVDWDDDTRYSSIYRLVRGYLEEDRLTEGATPPQG